MEDNGQQNREIWWKPAIMVFAGTSAWIAGPIILGLIIGKYLDYKYGTAPKFFIIFIALAFVITVLGILKMLRKYLKKP